MIKNRKWWSSPPLHNLYQQVWTPLHNLYIANNELINKLLKSKGEFEYTPPTPLGQTEPGWGHAESDLSSTIIS